MIRDFTSKILFGISLLTFSFCLNAQKYNFTFSQSQKTFVSLDPSQAIHSGQDWTQRNWKLPIGFHFTFQGKGFDSVTIKNKGLVSFDGSWQTCVSLLHGLIYKFDTNGVFSTIRYSTTGTAGQRIFCIEFAGTGLVPRPLKENINAQIWLYEQNGAIEFHFGSNSYQGVKDSTNMMVVGAGEFHGHLPTKGYLVTGKTTTATGKQILSLADLRFLTNIPPSGTVYTLVPVQ